MLRRVAAVAVVVVVAMAIMGMIMVVRGLVTVVVVMAQLDGLIRIAVAVMNMSAVLTRLMIVRLVAGSLDYGALHAVALAATAGVAVARAAAVGAIFGFLLGLAMGALIGFDQRLTIGDRDLVIVGMDFAEGQEAMAVAAILDEGGLQRRLYARHLGEVDVSAKLFALGGLEVKLFDSIAADHNDPGLFRVGGVDQHFVGHF
jgi:hypothetical protein